MKGFIFKYTYNVGGLGDMIQGMVNVLVLSKIFNTNLYFNIEHPIKNHFDYQELKSSNVEINTVDFLSNSQRSKILDSFLNQLFNTNNYQDKYITILSNITFYEILQTYGSFKELYDISYKEIFNHFKPKEYLLSEHENHLDNIVHIRFGDKYLSEALYNKNDNRSGNLDEIKDFLISVYDNLGKCKIVSDNTKLLEDFGTEISDNFDIETRKSIHFGYENTRDEDLIPTLQTFFDFKKYKKIIVKSYSGFSYLASRCFQITYVNYTELYMNRFTIVTACSENHFKTMLQFLDSFTNENMNIPYTCFIYDLGMDITSIELLKTRIENDNRFIIKTFDYSKYPEFFNININSGEYAWKSCIIKEVMDEIKYGSLLWCDVGNLFIDNIEKIRKEILLRNIYSPNSEGNIKKWTHSSTLDFFDIRFNEEFLSLRNRNSAIMGFNLNNSIVKNFIEEFNKLSAIKECIAPEGSNRNNHRQVQCIFTILYYGFMKNEDILNDYISLSIHNDITFYDCVILYGPNEDSIIHKCIEKAKENLINLRNIYVISYTKDFSNPNSITVYEKDFPFSYDNVNEYIKCSRTGWYLQQLLKIYSPYVIKDLLEYYLILDSDTIILKKLKMFDKYKGPLYNTGTEYHKPYFSHMNKVHPSLYKAYEKSGICHHMMFKKEYIEEIKKLIENYHNKELWRVLLEKIDHEQINGSGLSEYEIYFTYIYLNHRDSFTIRDLKWENRKDIPSNSDLDYVSVHWYMR